MGISVLSYSGVVADWTGSRKLQNLQRASGPQSSSRFNSAKSQAGHRPSGVWRWRARSRGFPQPPGWRAGEEPQLDQTGLLRVLVRETSQGFIQAKQGLVVGGEGDIDLVQIHPLQAVSMPHPVSPAGAVNENAPMALGRGAENGPVRSTAGGRHRSASATLREPARSVAGFDRGFLGHPLGGERPGCSYTRGRSSSAAWRSPLLGAIKDAGHVAHGMRHPLPDHGEPSSGKPGADRGRACVPVVAQNDGQKPSRSTRTGNVSARDPVKE